MMFGILILLLESFNVFFLNGRFCIILVFEMNVKKWLSLFSGILILVCFCKGSFVFFLWSNRWCFVMLYF